MLSLLLVSNCTALELERSGGPLGGGVVPLSGAIGIKKDKTKLAVDVDVIKPETLNALSESLAKDKIVERTKATREEGR